MILLKNYKTQTSIFTVLKSPHVNKTAQEHFKQCLYTKQFKIQSSQNFLFLILMKTLSYYLFSDINFKIELLIQKIKIKQNMKNKINPDNFYKLNNKLNLQIYVKLLNNYGKLILINKTKSTLFSNLTKSIFKTCSKM